MSSKECLPECDPIQSMNMQDCFYDLSLTDSKSLLQVCKGLQFCKNYVKIVHSNLVSESIFVNAKVRTNFFFLKSVTEILSTWLLVHFLCTCRKTGRWEGTHDSSDMTPMKLST